MLHFLLNVLIVLMIFFIPRLVIVATERFSLCRILGPVFLCYALGFLLQFILPHTGIAMDISEILVPVAIPLILFSADFGAARHLARPMIRSFLLAIASVFIVTVICFLIFRNRVDLAAQVGGMLTGLYTGGTPNLFAIGMALDVPESTIIIANTADLLAGGVYFMLLLSMIPPLYKKFLPHSRVSSEGLNKAEEAQLLHEFVPEKQPFTVKILRTRALMIGLAVACLAVSAGAALLLTGGLNVAVVMLGVTTLGVALSFVKKVRRTPGSFSSGQYLILMFSFAIGLSFDLSSLDSSSLALLIMLLCVQFGTVALHTVMAWLFKIDRDSTIITSTACIFGPAFIIPVSAALKNSRIILPGLVVGILGYALGNYLGVFTAWFLGLL